VYNNSSSGVHLKRVGAVWRDDVEANAYFH